MMKFIVLISIFLAQAIACDIHGSTGFMPVNSLYIPVGEKGTAMTEVRFLEIIGKVSDFYAPIVKEKGAVLIMDNNWEDGTVNAYAEQQGAEWHVAMFGGLARHPLVTDDGFALVVCHELGHHLGGAPKYGGTEWASNEGQADYWGAMKCFRRVFEKDDNVLIASQMEVDAVAIKKCEATFKTPDEIALCERGAMAGKSLAMLLGSLGSTPKVDFSTPDRKVVKKTNDAHPAAQCRLDTYFAGTLCAKSTLENVDDKNPKIGACTKSGGFQIGVRPLCWYKPASGE